MKYHHSKAGARGRDHPVHLDLRRHRKMVGPQCVRGFWTNHPSQRCEIHPRGRICEPQQVGLRIEPHPGRKDPIRGLEQVRPREQDAPVGVVDRGPKFGHGFQTVDGIGDRHACSAREIGYAAGVSTDLGHNLRQGPELDHVELPRQSRSPDDGSEHQGVERAGNTGVEIPIGRIPGAINLHLPATP